jgi:hypothetical protein
VAGAERAAAAVGGALSKFVASSVVVTKGPSRDGSSAGDAVACAASVPSVRMHSTVLRCCAGCSAKCAGITCAIAAACALAL